MWPNFMMQEEEKGYSSPQKAAQDIEKFLKGNMPKLGDYVARNEYGMHVYRYPKENQLAKVVEVYDEYRGSGSEIYNAILAIAIEPTNVRHISADLRLYKTIKAPDKNVISLWRK